MSKSMAGGCACGKVRFTAVIEPEEAYLCHCRMCQRATGSISVAYVNARLSDVEWHGEPDWFDSSPIARRPFCASCGTSLGFMFKENPEKMDLTVASFDDPSPFRPVHHFAVESMHRAWINTEGLPEYRSSDYPLLVEKWTEAVGKMPE